MKTSRIFYIDQLNNVYVVRCVKENIYNSFPCYSWEVNMLACVKYNEVYLSLSVWYTSIFIIEPTIEPIVRQKDICDTFALRSMKNV